MKNLRGIMIILAVFFLQSLAAKAQDSLYIQGKIFEKTTHVQLPGSRVEVLSGNDSLLINSGIASELVINQNEQHDEAIFRVKIPRKLGKYILRVSKLGYDTICQDVIIGKIHNRDYKIEVGPVYLPRLKTIELGEVDIKATKIKFYNRGDTLVYNADAFQLAEGSMLDALVRQLPGAELRKNGKIYVNGRFVDNLLLNGKDFFKGDKTVMLENLPNYMVSNILIYDKLGDKSKFVGQALPGDKQFVMDVKLKREYSVGWSGNFEGGMGTKNRYLGRLFAMRFTDHSRLAIYGNANNLNDARRPGENDNWSPSDLIGGQKEQQFGGLDYEIDGKDDKYNLNGNIQVKNEKNNSVTHTNRRNFLSQGDTYDRMVNANRNHDFTINTDHRLYFEGKSYSLELLPQFTYHKYDNTFNYLAITSSRNYADFGKDQLDSLFSQQLGKCFLSSVINRNLQNGKVKGHSLETGITANSTFKFKNSPDQLWLSLTGTYKDAKENHFDRNLIEYYQQEQTQKSTDFRNRYFDNRPERSYHLAGKLTYIYPSNKWYTLFLSYGYDRNYKSSYSKLYRLEQLDGWGEDTQQAIGNLPSLDSYLQTMDMYNSYNSRQYEDKHTLEPFINWHVGTAGGQWQGQLALPFSYQTRTMHYQRGDVDTVFTKRTLLLNVYSTYARWTSKDKTKKVNLSYDLQSKSPDMNLYLNIDDTTDPLNVRLGNSHLKNTYSHDVRGSYSRMLPKSQVLYGFEADCKFSTNAIAMGYTYDTQTGVRTFRPNNVNGNWQGNLVLAFFAPVNKKKNLMLKALVGPNYKRNVDLIGENGEDATRSVVKTIGFSENIELSYQLNSLTSFTFKSNCNFGHTTGSRRGFEPFSATDLRNGLIAQIQLPWKFQLGTDFTVYSRRGYADKEMNTDDFVWNARLSRPFLKGKVVAMVDGFDILGQLSNVTRVMNAQAITETYSNVIPRYLMFHVVYKFTKSPKRNR